MFSDALDVYLEIGEKRTFAGAIEWPGWTRSGRDEGSALQALYDYASRYAAVIQGSGRDFTPPPGVSAFAVVERLPGGSGTDFGAPSAIPAADARPAHAAELARMETLLSACWRGFDAAVAVAAGKELRKGPRGGGRELAAIVRHVLEADRGYLSAVGWKIEAGEEEDPAAALARTRQAALDALGASAGGEIPPTGPRGGRRWPARYFVRRVAWHVLDHKWEIEDRAP